MHSKNSLTERSMSLDCVIYLPTMSMSAPFAKASGAVSGVNGGDKTFQPVTLARRGSLTGHSGYAIRGDYWPFLEQSENLVATITFGESIAHKTSEP